MRAIALALIVALGLWGCGGNVNTTPVAPTELPPFAVTGPAATLDNFSGGTTSTLLGAAPVLPLFAFSEPTSVGLAGVAFWGTKDPATGDITSVTEAELYGYGTPPAQVHAFFNAAQLPALVRDDGSGYSLAIAYPSATLLSVTLCDPSGTALGQATSTIGTGDPTGDVSDGGSCTVTLVDAKARSGRAVADGTSDPTNLSGIADLAPLISSASYVAGLAFAVGAILKFKAHKDNPTQVPISAPIVFLFVAAALIFAPAVFRSVGGTLFDDTGAVPGVDGITPFYATPPS